MIQVTTTLFIAENDINETFIRSSGPGGQHVNKVSSSVQLSFNAQDSSSISPSVLRRLRIIAGRRMTKNGILMITSHRHRSQAQNRKVALGRLVNLLRQAATRPKFRRQTKPSERSKERRLTSKKRHSEIKKYRSAVKSTL